MKIEFIAGFGPIGTADSRSHDFWADTLGIDFDEPGEGYFATEKLPGAKAFAIWPLSHAAISVFGTPDWPDDVPAPQAWVEFDVASAEAVAEAVEELKAGGHVLLREVFEESWGQTVSRLLSPEGLLVGITHTPWMHTEQSAQA